MAEKLAEALRERREAVERIIRKVESLDQGEKSATDLASPVSELASAKTILAGITNFEDVLKWAKQNFEPSDVLLLETKFKKKLELHPERLEDTNYCRLLALIFYLMAAIQVAKVYGDFSHRAISDAFSTHLDMYHTLHLLKIACNFAGLTIQIYVLKGVIAEVIATRQDMPLSTEQEIALAKLCLLPEDGIPLEDGTPLIDLHFADDAAGSKEDKRVASKIENLSTIQDAINSGQLGTLTQRHLLVLEQEADKDGQKKKVPAPYYSSELALALQLRNRITVADIKRSMSPALLEKLTELWEILLPLHLDIGDMKDFQ